VVFLLDTPFTWPKRQRFTDEDANALAELVADKPVTDQLLFSEIWRQRTRASVISLEEGVMEHWHHGRICLLGDAVHKVRLFASS
jgi:2-polyprenyl-6-methoxyphenol hydroxylase-like FAD-dependent oxidoreductase